MAILKGELYYTFLRRVDSAFGTDKWKLSLALEGDQLAKAKELGLQLREDSSGKIPGQHIQIKRNCVKKNGEKANPVEVIDAKKAAIPDAVVNTIGNGTVAKVKFNDIEYAKGKKTLYLEKVQILDLVPYVPGGDFDEEDGFETEEYTESNDGEDFEDESGETTEGSEEEFED